MHGSGHLKVTGGGMDNMEVKNLQKTVGWGDESIPNPHLNYLAAS